MRGIGHATAIAFASLGADVVVTGTGRAPSTFPADEQAVGWRDVESVAEEIRALGRRALPMKVDVSSGASLHLHRYCSQRGSLPRHTGELREPRHHGHRPQRQPVRLPARREMDTTAEVHPPGKGWQAGGGRQVHRMALQRGGRVYRGSMY